VTEQEHFYNFYAIVVNATSPYRAMNGKSDRYVCTMRIVDPFQSCTPAQEGGIVETCTLTLFSNAFEDLPISQRVGDIIRVHRATVSDFHGVKQFVSCIYFNSSWALFSPVAHPLKLISAKGLGFVAPEGEKEESREFTPFRYFGKSYSAVGKKEQTLLK
jgi:hypothetical protein